MYSIDTDKIVREIGSAKRVLLQLPDGLKPRAVELASELKRWTGAEILVWAGSNFGGCDIPNANVDVIINVGHAEFPL